MHLVELDSGKKILLDCGLYQGRRAEANKINRHLPYNAEEIDVVLLSHAHIDHSGLLPGLWKAGFRGQIFATHATYDLCALMLLDSAHIQEKDALFVNKRARKRGRDVEPVTPIYETPDAEGVLEHFVGVSYRQRFSPVEGVVVEYRDAGHILGSASMVLHVTEGGQSVRLGFTGDVGRPNRPILRDPQKMEDCDYLIAESTYGGEVHDPPDTSRDRLRDVVKRTSDRGGKVIIPAFSVGRTQEIVYILDQLEHDGELAPVPVFVDSPLAVNATGVFQVHPECYDRELREYIIKDGNAFGFRRLKYVRNVEESKQLNVMEGPAVIISASGMCEAGRILHHLRNNIEDSRNTILMVGYCADHTLGKRIIDRDETVRIFGEEHDLKAEVVVMNSYSAHADEPEMVDFVSQLDRERLKKIYLVHGSPDRQDRMREGMNRAGFTNIEIPERGHSVVLT
jgi:metallo-beta-lactamase family protein